MLPNAVAASRRRSASAFSSCSTTSRAGTPARLPISPKERAADLKTNGFCSRLLFLLFFEGANPACGFKTAASAVTAPGSRDLTKCHCRRTTNGISSCR